MLCIDDNTPERVNWINNHMADERHDGKIKWGKMQKWPEKKFTCITEAPGGWTQKNGGFVIR